MLGLKSTWPVSNQNQTDFSANLVIPYIMKIIWQKITHPENNIAHRANVIYCTCTPHKIDLSLLNFWMVGYPLWHNTEKGPHIEIWVPFQYKGHLSRYVNPLFYHSILTWKTKLSSNLGLQVFFLNFDCRYLLSSGIKYILKWKQNDFNSCLHRVSLKQWGISYYVLIQCQNIERADNCSVCIHTHPEPCSVKAI